MSDGTERVSAFLRRLWQRTRWMLPLIVLYIISRAIFGCWDCP